MDQIKTRTTTSATGGPTTWRLGYLRVCEKEARKLLNDSQYEHVLYLFDDLARSDDPRRSETQDVRAIEDFYELRDKGGILGKINLRVYFAVFDNVRVILALSCHKKENEGKTPGYIKAKVRNRMRYAKELLSQEYGGR